MPFFSRSKVIVVNLNSVFLTWLGRRDIQGPRWPIRSKSLHRRIYTDFIRLTAQLQTRQKTAMNRVSQKADEIGWRKTKVMQASFLLQFYYHQWEWKMWENASRTFLPWNWGKTYFKSLVVLKPCLSVSSTEKKQCWVAWVCDLWIEGALEVF